MTPNLDRRIADLEKAAPPAKHRPKGMASEEFMHYAFAKVAGLPEERKISELTEWMDLMTIDELTALSAAIEAARSASGGNCRSRKQP